MRREIAESLEKNRHEMEERLQLTKNFDLVERKLKVGDRDACLYFVDGFVKDEVLEKLMEFFQSLKPELLLENGKAFSGIFVPYVEVDILNSFVPILLTLVYQNVKRVSIVFQEFSQIHLQKKNLSAKKQTGLLYSSL